MYQTLNYDTNFELNMDMHKTPFLNLIIPFLCLLVLSCNNGNDSHQAEIVKDPDQMDKIVKERISAALSHADREKGKINDSILLNLPLIVKDFYGATENDPVWSSAEKWLPFTDSLFHFIINAKQEGLFPEDYHLSHLVSLKNKLDGDSLKKMDATQWATADLMLTDGFMRIIKDLKRGRLKSDSVTILKDTSLSETFFINTLQELVKEKQFARLVRSVQPKNKGYWELKKGIRGFVDSMDLKSYTYLNYPYKKGNSNDSVFFIRNLQKRLNQGGCIDFTSPMPDTLQLSTAIKKYQIKKGLKADGKISTALIRLLNTSDVERFKRIAITLDKYKLMPDGMPKKYIWVNLPGFYLRVFENDTVVLESKVICGKPETRTPLLNSEITDMVTYPTWTVPTSIISKQYLPKLKNNPNYLSRIGLKLVGRNGETIDPSTINWAKYSKGIPYQVVQGSGDNNALGVLKFNFNNPYSVYLHDTNQRYLFKNASRALSHGCVRVQEWEKLAFYIARNDSMNRKNGASPGYTTDSIRNWIAAKERHRIEVKNHIPVYLQYFTCEGVNGKIKFYDDIYGEDKVLRDKYFADK